MQQQFNTNNLKDFAGKTDPIFVTVRKDNRVLGCIGNMSAQNVIDKTKNLSENIINDVRFDADVKRMLLSKQQLPTKIALQVSVSLLHSFEQMDSICDFEIGKHGIVLTMFDSVNGLHEKTALFLPEVAMEQQWDQRTTIAHLILKTGISQKDVLYKQIKQQPIQTVCDQSYKRSKFGIAKIQRFQTTLA